MLQIQEKRPTETSVTTCQFLDLQTLNKVGARSSETQATTCQSKWLKNTQGLNLVFSVFHGTDG